MTIIMKCKVAWEGSQMSKNIFTKRFDDHHALQGGMGGVSNAIAKSALAAGAELYTSR